MATLFDKTWSVAYLDFALINRDWLLQKRSCKQQHSAFAEIGRQEKMWAII